MYKIRVRTRTARFIILSEGRPRCGDIRNLIFINTPEGQGFIFPFANLDSMEVELIEDKAPVKQPVKPSKCRSCRFDMSDDHATMRTDDCPDHLDGKINDGCDKYQPKEK